jgi:glyoxylase-like metal-dependent hydrolase (beta-lactamase superfamily II)
MAPLGFAADDNIFAWKCGDIEVWTLVESRGNGNPSILVKGDDAVKKYLPGGTYQSETNVFLVKSGGKTIVIDTGFGRTIFDSMKALGVSPDKVDTVLLTHTHGDHIGGLSTGDGKARFPNAELLLSERELDWSRSNNATQTALAPYIKRIKTFKPAVIETYTEAANPELAPGIRPVAAFGHTPGHSAFMLESKGQKLLVWGDLMHVQDVQFPEPGISVTYDSDGAAAAKIRKQLLEYAALNKIPIAGMHLRYPAIGFVEKQGEGYKLVTN